MYRKTVLIIGFIAIFGTSAVRIPTLSDLPGSFNAVVTTITNGTIGKSTIIVVIIFKQLKDEIIALSVVVS